MANTFNLTSKGSIGVTTVGVYTAPSSTTTVIIGITCANTSGSGIHVGVGITRAGAGAGIGSDNIKLIKDVPIPQGSSFEFMQGNKIVLQQTDTLTASSDVASSLDVALTIMEIT